MSNVIDLFKDIEYITGSDCEPHIVGVKCENISIQLSCDLHNVLLGDVEIKRNELIAFILAVGIDQDLTTKQERV